MTNSRVELSVITIHKESLGEMLPTFEKAIMHRHRWQVRHHLQRDMGSLYVRNPDTDYATAEKRVLDILREYTQTQEAIPAVLTKGEKIALAIREQVYQHMDGNIQVSDLAKEHKISERESAECLQVTFWFHPETLYAPAQTQSRTP